MVEWIKKGKKANRESAFDRRSEKRKDQKRKRDAMPKLKLFSITPHKDKYLIIQTKHLYFYIYIPFVCKTSKVTLLILILTLSDIKFSLLNKPSKSSNISFSFIIFTKF